MGSRSSVPDVREVAGILKIPEGPVTTGRRAKYAVLYAACLLLAACLTAAFPARAGEDSEYAIEKTGIWKYAFDPMKVEPRSYAMTPVELENFKKKLALLAEIIHGTAILNPPRGIDAVASGFACVPDDHYGQYKAPFTTQRIRSALFLGLMFFEKEGGKIIRADTCVTNMLVYFNNPGITLKDCGVGQLPLRDDEGRKICFMPRMIRKMAGYPMYGNSVIVISKNPKPYWLPVSRERYLRALIMRSEAAVKKGDRYETRVLDVFKKELDSTAPDKRRAQAYLCNGGSNLSGLCAPDAEGAQPLVVFNPDFFDPSLPRTAVQLIAISWAFDMPYDYVKPIRLTKRTNPAQVRLSELMESADYRKIAELIDTR